MDDDPYPTINIPHKALISFGEPCGAKIVGANVGGNTVEKTSVVWGAAEALTSPDLETRQAGLEELVSQDAVRQHPLVAYLLISKLVEPDIALRAHIVDALSDVVIPNGHGEPALAPSYNTLATHLTGMRTRQIYALLQVVDYDKSNEDKVIGLLDHCSFAGGHLSCILATRTVPVHMRKWAAYFIGQMGYLDAMPILERLAARLETRQNGRSELGGMDEDEADLLSSIRSALELLRAP
jgi:hypothetical protein